MPLKKAVWGEKIRAWVKDPSHVVVSATARPGDDLNAALMSLMADLRAKTKVANPFDTRARLYLEPGIYQLTQTLDLRQWRASDNAAIEIVGLGATREETTIKTTGKTTCVEHGGVSALFAHLTLASEDAWCVHGSGRDGLAEELIFYDCHLSAHDGRQAFSHELGDKHLLYFADSLISSGQVYMHTIARAEATGTTAIFDGTIAPLNTVVDESVSPNDLLLIRGGFSTLAPVFTVGFQRTGSPDRAMLTVVIDPDSGLTVSPSARVEFRQPQVSSFKILDESSLAHYWANT
ncbi:hypothetical protein [Rothia sp. ZJ1223]|uniref:hypothetical protein n=1 Tax=Rothia sp. ZJ1223 TaxID=2811098 RepID=UPI00195E7410|nr:hypothetical protein [Rothia sp. ZJ1223]MBM7052213.1 hypothetical protein [Rothia sp. ZJ1223]